jgi:hypothetical protein
MGREGSLELEAEPHGTRMERHRLEANPAKKSTCFLIAGRVTSGEGLFGLIFYRCPLIGVGVIVAILVRQDSSPALNRPVGGFTRPVP